MKLLNTLLVALIVFSANIAFAQSEYNVRFNNKQADCDRGIVLVDIEINAPTASINLTEQNYRFTFNNDAVANPRIVQELTVSGMVNNSFYAEHTLKGSVSNIVSYNVELSGGDGYQLDDEWVSVGRLAFDIMDDTRCMGLTWNDNNTFPPTFVGEMVGNSRKKSNGTLFGSLNDCEFCDENTTIDPLADKGGFEVFPNPATADDAVSITYNADLDQDATIVVMDVNGKTVIAKAVSLNEGINTLALNHQKLQTGTYLVQLRMDGEVTTAKKFVKFGR